MQNPGILYVIATFLPMVSFLLLFFGGKRWPGKTGGYVAIAGIGGAFVCSLIGFITFLGSMPHHDHHDKPAAATKAASDDHGKKDDHAHKDDHGKKNDHGQKDGHGHHGAAGHEHHEPFAWAGHINWAVLNNFGLTADAVELRLGYHIDALGATMFLMVTFIATLIHIFATGYMSEELQDQVEDHQAHITRKGRFPRFFMWFALFSFSMLNLVLADNLFQIFISWELVGICSFGLIGFYYERHSASTAANKAFITNRVGDAGFILGILILWTYCGTLSFNTVREPVRDEKGEIKKNEHDGVDYVYTQLSFFDALRAPKEDSDGEHLKFAGQFVRVEPVRTKSGHLVLQGSPTNQAGSEVIIWDRATREGHFHGPDSRNQYPARDPARRDDHGLKTMPYWMLVLAGIGIFLGCVGKSAQFPLQTWLPDAMEGPTPVSALVHSATMVAAGVYLVGRAYPLFTPEVLLTIAYVGAITAFMAATIAIVQTDIKKVLAYSTVSQLGFMMLALGVGGWVAGLFHLLTHAFFKALLFLCSGSVIHGCHHEQDMRRMGGLYSKMKITALTMLMGVLAIAGTPLFSGWYSKDLVLVSSLSFVSLNREHILLFILPLVTAGLTAFYMFRLWFMTFCGEPRDHHVHEHAHESPWSMTVPLLILAVMSVIVAWGPNPFNVQGSTLEAIIHHSRPESLTVDTGLSLSTAVRQADNTADGGNFFANDSWLQRVAARLEVGPHDLAGVLALLSAGIGVVFAFAMYYFRVLDPAATPEKFPQVNDLLHHKWYFDELYDALLVRPSVIIGRWAKWFDANVIDGIIHGLARGTVTVSKWDGQFDAGIVDGAVNLTAKVVFGVGDWIKGIQTGYIRNYVLYMAVAAIGLYALLSYVISASP
jgi:NADH-quinone oxidoreductase subunit L